MTILQTLLIENANNEENKKAILYLAREEGKNLIEENEDIEDVFISNTGEVTFEFTQEILDVEAIGDLVYSSAEKFNDNFNFRIKIELPHLL